MRVFTTPPLRVVKHTEKAILFDPGESDDQAESEVFWIPKAAIEDPDIEELEVGTVQEITIPYDLAQEKGLV